MEYPTGHVYFLGKHTSLKCVHQKNTSDKWEIPWYTTTERCITILYHDMEKTLTDTIIVTYTQSMMGRLDVIPSNINVFPVF